MSIIPGKRLTNKNDIKIFILYLLQNIQYPLDFATINDIVAQNEYVNYFDFAECFAELLDMGHIVEEVTTDPKTHEESTCYRISELGSDIVSQLQSNLLRSIREQSLKSALRLLSFRKRGAKVSCKTTEQDDGKYSIECTITEMDKEILHIHLVDDSRSRVERMRENFEDRPDVIYKGVMALLAGEVDYLLN
ncbi:MAG: DUF4364 family protein [Clostridia bacterium]|nr:DUF4364 family protein [Clostridia bacterium]